MKRAAIRPGPASSPLISSGIGGRPAGQGSEPGFTGAQRTILERAGLDEEAIEGLRVQLPLLKWTLEPAPLVGPVRERLLELENALGKANRLLLKLVDSKPNTLAREIFHLLLADGSYSETPSSVSYSIAAMCALSAATRKRLPTQQRRRTHWRAIERIAEVLQGKMTPSRSGEFLRIVEVCWHAVGLESTPDRHIRAYLEHVESRQDPTRGIKDFDAVGSRGRRRKAARSPKQDGR